jgi:hypothetical protein
LRRDLPGHVVDSVPLIGCAGIQNGELLARAATEFDVLITMDGSLPKQQNLARHKIAVIGLRASSNRLADTRPLMPKVLTALSKLQAGKIFIIE